MKKQKRGNLRRRVRQLPLPTFGEFVVEEFLKPHGLSLRQLAAAMPRHPNPNGDWLVDLTRMFGRWSDEFLVTDHALLLDRMFGCTEGYFLRLWATAAARRRARKMHRWLATARPLFPVSQRPLSKATLARVKRGLREAAARKTVYRGSFAKHVGKITTTHELHDWAQHELARKRHS